jgi:hypothetical protein
VTEPQSGLMDQIHDLKAQLADAEKRANERKWECDNLHVGVYTWDEAVAALTGAGVAAELEERGLPGAIEALTQQRDDAEKRGAVNALRGVADHWTQCGDDETGARRLRTLADAIASGRWPL